MARKKTGKKRCQDKGSIKTKANKTVYKQIKTTQTYLLKFNCVSIMVVFFSV